MAINASRRKLLARTPNNIYKAKGTTPVPRRLSSKRESQISPRHLWRSSVPRAQHNWQVAATAAANTDNGTELQRIYSLMSQLYRRNKNQHRSQMWWKWLSLLRRQIGVLVRIESELKGNEHSATDPVAVRRQLERESELQVQRKTGERFVTDVLLGRCYLAFSVVVQDSQFAALGIVLLGVLASVGKELELPRVVVEKISGISLRQTGVDRGEVVAREYRSPKPGSGGDVEEVIEKSAVGKGNAREANGRKEVEMQKESHGAARSSTSSTEKKVKKKKGKKSAIDDLFAGLF